MPAMITVKGVVLRETAYGEHDKLFDLFTENGIYTVRARGVRKQGSKYAAVTQVFSYGEFCLRQSGERYFLDSAVPVNLFFGLRGDLEALALAAYFAELLRNTATQQPQPQILRLFLHCLHYLCEHTRPPLQIKAIFELRLATELGHAPNLLCCNLCGEFLPQQLYFRVSSGDFVCKDCRISDAWNKMYRTQFVRNSGAKFQLPNIYNGNELKLNLNLALHCPIYCICKESLLFHRMRQGSRVQRKASCQYTWEKESKIPTAEYL